MKRQRPGRCQKKKKKRAGGGREVIFRSVQEQPRSGQVIARRPPRTEQIIPGPGCPVAPCDVPQVPGAPATTPYHPPTPRPRYPPETEEQGGRPPGFSAHSHRGEAAGRANPSHRATTTPGQRSDPGSQHPAPPPGTRLGGVCSASAALPPGSPYSGTEPRSRPRGASATSPQRSEVPGVDGV